MKDGFFLMHRGWRDNPIFRGEFSRADAWVWLIENACWKPTRTRIKGETVTLDRGELSFSIRFLADAWGWSKSRVDRFLADLRDEGMIETRSKNGTPGDQKTGQGQAIITICNYRKYQDAAEDQRDNSGTTSGTTAGQQRDKEEQGNKLTIEEEPIGSPSSIPAKRKSAAKIAMTEDWQPGPLPADVAELVAQWPPGRLDTEVCQFRDYWLDRSDKRPGWDRTYWRWLRTTHDRVMRENRHGTAPAHAARDYRDGFDRGLDRRIAGGGS